MNNALISLSKTPDPVCVDAAICMPQTEAALRQERSISEAVLECVPALVLVLDANLRMLRYNRCCELSTGYSLGGFAGREIWPLFFADEDADRFRAGLGDAREKASAGRFESYWRKRDGSAAMISWTITALFDSTSAGLFVAAGVDITEDNRLESAAIEIRGREQRRIGQDLHDGLGQHLTGIAFLAKVQEQKLAERSLPESGDAAKIVRLVNEAIHKTRELARGLLPVLSGPHGLCTTLQEWAAEVEDIFRIDCRYEGDDAVCIQDAGVADHLFRIAQEAVHNAIRHGKARTITMTLRAGEEGGALTIRDDGSGMDVERSTFTGLGMRIMDYRARMIGGCLRIQRGAAGGTVVTCLFSMLKESEIQ